jgi:L-aminopeptidase/D-esterase-like protein
VALSKFQAAKVAQMAHNGASPGPPARLTPCSTLASTIFSLSTGMRPLPEPPGIFNVPQAQALNELGAAAAHCFTLAVIKAVLAGGGSAPLDGDRQAYFDDAVGARRSSRWGC